MPYEILKHTADLRMKVRGKTLRELFGDAAKGMMRVMKGDVPEGAARVTRRIALHASDPTALLVDFLNEVLSSSHIHREIYPAVLVKELSDSALLAELHGVPVEDFDEDVKAVTYHEAEVAQNKKGEWETILVLDI